MERLVEGGTRVDSTENRRSDAQLDHVITALTERGLALVTGLTTRTNLLRLAQSLAVVVPHRDSDPDGVTTLTDLGEIASTSGPAGFGAVTLSPHTDCSGIPSPPALLMMNCSTVAMSGGQSVLVDGQAVYVLDNHRWLHGRKAFTGHRVVHRVHGDPLPGLDIVTGLRSVSTADST